MLSYKLKTPLEIVEEIAKESSRNKKVEILKSAISQNPLFKMVLEATYNPYITYGVKAVPEFEDIQYKVSGIMTLNKFIKTDLYAKLAKRAVTGNDAMAMLKNSLEQLHQDDRVIAVRILGRDLRCGISVKSINKACPGLIPEYNVMLASEFDQDTVDKMGDPIVQLKVDGMRACAHVIDGVVTFRSRKGHEIDVGDDLRNEVLEYVKLSNNPSNVVFDGELIAMATSNTTVVANRERGNGLLNKCMRGTASEDEKKRVRFVVFDYLLQSWFDGSKTCNVPYRHRLNSLLEVLRLKDSKLVWPVRTFDCKRSEIQSVFEDVLSDGEEGLLIKDGLGYWEPKRSKQWIKLKAVLSTDLVVVDVLEGVGKYAGMMGSLKVETSCGQLTAYVGTGFSDEDRRNITKDDIGRIVEVRYNSVIIAREGFARPTLYLPVFGGFRDDKEAANTYSDIRSVMTRGNKK